jgi:hypothetical protein
VICPSNPLLFLKYLISEVDDIYLTDCTSLSLISTSLNGKAGDPIGLQFLGSNPEVDGLIALSNTTTMPEWSKGTAVVAGGWLRKYVKIFGFLV